MTTDTRIPVQLLGQDGPMDVRQGNVADASGDGDASDVADAQVDPEVGTAELVPVRPGSLQPRSAVEITVDVALGASVALAGPAVRVVRGVTGRATGVAAGPLKAGFGVIAHPPLIPPGWAPGAMVGRLADRGAAWRRMAGMQVSRAAGDTADLVVPAMTDQLVGRIDLTDLVLSRVDLHRIVIAALDSLDLTEVVLARVDLGAVVQKALDELDLTAVVVDRVDLAAIVTAALDGLDLTDLVRSRVDLAGLADQVIDDVDLPAIIRESSTGVASDVVQGARLGAISADEQVSRIVDRLLLRRRARRTEAPGSPAPDRSAESEPAAASGQSDQSGGPDGSGGTS